MTKKLLILASTSPRRRELLQQLKIPFAAHAPRFEEHSVPELSPQEEAQLFAREKALSLRHDFPNAIIIGSDTIVALGASKLGKPQDAQDALRMLTRLSGQTHEVLTALAVLDAASGEILETLSVAQVRMKPNSVAELEAYVATGEPMDKAGAYAVQGLGAKLIESVEGDFLTVVGLPLQQVVELLEELGIETEKINLSPAPKIEKPLSTL